MLSIHLTDWPRIYSSVWEASIVQACSGPHRTHRPNIFGHLTYLSDTVGLKKVIAPSLNRTHIVKAYWIRDSGEIARGVSVLVAATYS
jgi:hypothetical protein